MHLSSQEEYGLRCLLQLARHDGDGPMRIQEIADLEGLTPEYVAKLMRVLRKGGAVTSTRGAAGGYHLVRQPDSVSLGEVMDVIEGSTNGNGQSCSASPDSPAVKVLMKAWHDVTSVERNMLNEITFADPEDALEDLISQYDLSPGDPATLFDIAGDVDIIIDPGSGDVRMRLDSDDLLVTKSSKTTEIAAGYSREAWSTERGNLYLGVEGKFYALDLTRIGVRFGDITDSEELFDSIRNSEFERDSGFGFDIGALWVGGSYQLGATLTNANEPSFDYPDVDTSFYRDGSIVEFLLNDKTYTMERQLKLEGSWFSPARRWTANVGRDANDVRLLSKLLGPL